MILILEHPHEITERNIMLREPVVARAVIHVVNALHHTLEIPILELRRSFEEVKPRVRVEEHR